MSPRFEKTESYFGRGDACMALAISSLKVSSESTDGRTRDCCIFDKWEVFRIVLRFRLGFPDRMDWLYGRQEGQLAPA
jgi:hypothetical protein